jgi:hypothetical protein
VSEDPDAISKVIFATGGCYGECPYYAIEIDAALNYKYDGGKYAKSHATFKG